MKAAPEVGRDCLRADLGPQFAKQIHDQPPEIVVLLQIDEQVRPASPLSFP
jgi:hypothetical protein